MPDLWELETLGSTTNRPDADPDADGMSNVEEYLADTQPTNGASRFRISQLQHAAGFVVGADGRSNRMYHLWRNTNAAVALASWEEVDSSALLGSHATITLADTNAANPAHAWYRMQVEAP